MPAATGGDADARAAALSARIGAEFDRRLDARLAPREPTATNPARGRPGLPAAAVPGARQRPRPPADVNRGPRQPLWFGIVIGSVVSGIAAVAAGVDISALVGTYHGGSEPYVYINAAGEILAVLTVVWALLLLACIAHALARRARDRRRPQ
jgi:hypothetical protein